MCVYFRSINFNVFLCVLYWVTVTIELPYETERKTDPEIEPFWITAPDAIQRNQGGVCPLHAFCLLSYTQNFGISELFAMRMGIAGASIRIGRRWNRIDSLIVEKIWDSWHMRMQHTLFTDSLHCTIIVPYPA